MRNIDNVGKLRGTTANARALDPVKVVVYVPGIREPLVGEISGFIYANPIDGDESRERVLTLQVRTLGTIETPPDRPAVHVNAELQVPAKTAGFKSAPDAGKGGMG